jgi:hypothetical protein
MNSQGRLAGAKPFHLKRGKCDHMSLTAIGGSMLKFTCSILILTLLSAISLAQTPKPAPDGTNASSKLGGVITGRVTNERGEPMVDERIFVSRTGSREDSHPIYADIDPYMYFTDDRGVFRIYGLPEGRYVVSAGYVSHEANLTFPTPRQFYPRTYYQGVFDKDRAKVVEVAAGAVAAGIDITLSGRKKSYDVYGRVVNADTGGPVEGVTIACGEGMGQGRAIASITSRGEPSDSKGQFQLTNVAPGRHILFVQANDMNDYISEPAAYEIADEDLHGVEVKVRQAGSISGIAVIEGAEGASALSILKKIQITCQYSAPDPSNLRPGGGAINPDGSFKLRAIPPGKLKLLASSVWRDPGVMLSRIERNGEASTGEFDVVAGEQITGVRLYFAYGSLTLRGRLKIAGGEAPDTRWSVLARRTDFPPQDLQLRAEVNAGGAFTFDRLTPGEYELCLLPATLNGLDARTLRALISFKERVIVAGDGKQVDLLLDLSQKEK